MIRLPRPIARHLRDEDGSTLIEFAVVTSLFLLILFGLIDFARLSFSNVMAEKATERAVRMAVVRPAVCPDIPEGNGRGALGGLALTIPNGTRCTEFTSLCTRPPAKTCTGSLDHPTVATIWSEVAPLLPSNATPENLSFTYSYDPALNRVGAYYTPIVTVELTDLQFDFISPLGALATAAGATGAQSLGESFVFPSMSASLPAETIR
ncbi:TadE/TadG family type IV pilus assembly protein [Sulfitobacter sp. HNIBRBA3233]|uniref:TadE/TadG family type IV pilus assembly protein n=1 Tax=Sulfitobacter marinivivus TaxID=3158558 RepID=UPI0032DF9F8C